MLITVDALDFAVPDCSIDFLLRFLRLEDVDFEEGKTMRVNYKKSLYITGLKIGYDNPVSQYSCYVNMSGQGCRLYEDLMGDGFDWFVFIKSLIDLNVDFRRIDIAVDDYTDLINPNKLIKYYAAGKYAGSLRSCEGHIFKREEFQAGADGGHFIVRVYNKALERGYSEEELGHPWVRCEMQLRDKKATQFIDEWISSGDLCKIYCGHLLEGIRFLTKPNDLKNSQRIPIAPFWKKFCHDAQRIPFIGVPGTKYNLSKLERYLKHQIASSVRTYIAVNHLTPEQLYNFFDNDDIRLNKDQLALLKARDRYYLYSDVFERIDYLYSDAFDNMPADTVDKIATKEEIEDCIIDAIIGADVYQEPQQMRFDDVK